ncbi:MAG: LamG-like jellyroll fold domain-containing protein, partial [Akkermansiaceae bacterium]
YHTKSTDGGLTWSARTEITTNVKLPAWGWYATGPCHGVQLKRGIQAGRLVIPANHRIGNNGQDAGSFGAQVVYSDDHGATWQMTAMTDGINGAAPNETTLVELITPAGDGGSRLYINSRDYGSDPGTRSEAYSDDGGASYSFPYNGNAHFVTPVVQGSLLRFKSTDEGDTTNRILLSCPNGGSRNNGSIWSSSDETSTWSQPKLLLGGAFAYSDMVKTTTDHLGVLAETNNYGAIKFIRVNEEWLDAPDPVAENPSAAFWNFEEKAIGETATTGSASLLDIHPSNNKRHLTPDAAFSYLAGSPNYNNSKALKFTDNGGLSIEDYLTENNFDFAGDDSFTLEAVIRIPNGTSNTGAIVAKDLGANQPSWWLRVETAGHVRFLVSDNTSEALVSTGTTTVNDGNWHQIAAVKDGTNKRLKIYVDGILISDVPDTTTGTHANSQPLSIGKFNASSSRDFIGDIDFVRISPSVIAPANFVSNYTQHDADSDNIPDSYERMVSGNTNDLGTGDFDHDGYDDLIEFTTGSSPIDSSAKPLLMFQTTSATSSIFRFRKKDLPSWLTLEPQFSKNLTDWTMPIPDVTISNSSEMFDDTTNTFTYTLTSDDPLSSFFARLIVTSSQAP